MSNPTELTPELVLEQVTADCEGHFGERKFKRLRKQIELTWFHLCPDRTLVRLPNLRQSKRKITRAIAHDFVGRGRVKDAIAVRPANAPDFRFWMDEVYGAFTQLRSSDLFCTSATRAVLQHETYLRAVQIIELINTRRMKVHSAPEPDDQQKEVADAAAFFANVAWFNFLYQLLFDEPDTQLHRNLYAPIKNMRGALSRGRNHRNYGPHSLQYPDARDLLLIIEWVTLNRFMAFDDYEVDEADEGEKLSHTLALDRRAYKSWINQVFGEVPDQLMLETLKQFNSGPIPDLAINHARIAITLQRLGHDGESEQELQRAKALFACCPELDVSDRVQMYCWLAQAEPNSSSLDQAIDLVIRESEQRTKQRKQQDACLPLWCPIIKAAFETNRWDCLRIRLTEFGHAKEFTNAKWLIDSVTPCRPWRRRIAEMKSRESQLQTWLDFIKPTSNDRLSGADLFNDMIAEGNWRDAEKVEDTRFGDELRAELIAGCIAKTEGLSDAVRWCENIEDFRNRQRGLLGAVMSKVPERETHYHADIGELSCGSLTWPTFGC